MVHMLDKDDLKVPDREGGGQCHELLMPFDGIPMGSHGVLPRLPTAL